MSDDEISIKINICDRYYPLRIKISEEENVRKAAKTINERAKYYIENFSVQDKQDALSMVALEIASRESEENTTDIDFENVEDKLKNIEQLLKK
jgi:cell division protein ZapA (FtsZ GTPase activity inhibitor)